MSSDNDQFPRNVITVAPPIGFWNTDVFRKYPGEASASIAMSTWIVFANFILLIAILRSDRLRKVSFNLHVCNLCLTNIFMGSLVLPLYGHFFHKGYWDFGDSLCRVWLVADLMVCTISVLVVCMMTFDRFVLFSCTETAEGGCKFVFSAIIIAIPWTLACAFVIPVYLKGEAGDGVDATQNSCYLSMGAVHSVIYIFGGYAVPAVATLGLLVATSLTWCVRRHELRGMERSEEREHKGWQVLLAWIICFAVIFMWLPFNALHLLGFILHESFSIESKNAVMWLAFANPALTPLLWMIKPRLRRCVLAFLCCCCRSSRSPHRGRYQRGEMYPGTMEIHEKL